MPGEAGLQLPGHLHGAVRRDLPVAIRDGRHLDRELWLHGSGGIHVGQARVEDVPVFPRITANARVQGERLAIPAQPQDLRSGGRRPLSDLTAAGGPWPSAPDQNGRDQSKEQSHPSGEPSSAFDRSSDRHCCPQPR